MKRRITSYLALLLITAMMLSLSGIAEITPDAVDSVNIDYDSSVQNEEIELDFEVDDSSIDIGESDLMDPSVMESSEDLLLVDADSELVISDLDEESTEDVEPNATKGLPSKLTLGVKQKYAIKASAFGKGKKLTYASSKAAVASVSKSGVITAKKKGKTTITVKKGKKKLATCVVTVVDAPKKVSFSKKSYSVDINKKITLKPVITKGSCASYTWSVKDKEIATVTSSGVVQGKKAGKTTITVKTHNGKNATCTVTVKDGVKAMGWEDFAGASAEIIKEYKSKVSVSDADSEYASGRLIVKVSGQLPDLSQFKVKVIVRDKDDHYLIQLDSDTEAEKCAKYLSGFSNVVYVEPDCSVTAGAYSATASRSSFNSWGVSAIHADAYAEDLKNRGKTGTVKVAVVDSGVDFSHSMLKGRIKKGYDFIDNDKNPKDGDGHGTHVSGTIVDCTPDLNILIIAVRSLDDNGSGTSLTVGEGVKYAADHGADIINLSLGGDHSAYLDECIQYAVKHNVTVVVAAGNEHSNTKYSCPAHIENCITVAAVDEYKERAYFSNYGDAIDIAAPGVAIKSCIPGNKYDTWNGTSMATPHVSAAAAMLLLDNPGLSPSTVVSKLRSAATDLGSSGWDEYYGAGFLNLQPFIQDQPKKTYTVSYNANGGTGAPSNQTKTEGQALTLSSTKPQKNNTIVFDYGTGETTNKSVSAVFKNWNTQANGGGTAYNSGASYTTDANVTLYAQWQPGTIGSLPSPTLSGYTFVGWYTALYGGSSITSSTTVTSDMTVYAHWSENSVSDWVEASQVPSNATVVETKTQYRYSDLSYSDWSGWSGWDINRQETSDLKKEESATVWYWYRFVCPHCGAHMHVWDKCHTWAGGCGNFIGSDRFQVIWLTTPPSGGVQNWEGTGRIMLGNSSRDRWFFWVDASQGYPNGDSRTGYRYATRTKSWGSWSAWSDSYVSSSDTRQVETRTMCRYRMN